MWTGRELRLHGAVHAPIGTPHGAGAAYNPASNRWSVLSTSVLRGRTGHVAVWTGTQMLIWGGTPVSGGGSAGDGAAYTPSPL